MRPLLVLVLVALAASACDSSAPTYSGPADYAYTLTVSCYCALPGPLRITVHEDDVVDIRRLAEGGTDEEYRQFIDGWSLTLDELSAYVERATREADDIEATYHPTFGFPTDVSIDWYLDAVDDEIGFTVRDFDLL